MWINFSKVFYVLIVFYYGWFQIVFFPIPKMLLLLGAGMIGFILVHAIETRTNILTYFPKELVFWFLFLITSLIFGLIVAKDYGILLSAIQTYGQFLVLILGILYISYNDKRVDFFVNVFIVFAILCALTTIFIGIDYGFGRITMGKTNNPNSLGITMVIGVCCILYNISFKKIYYLIPYLGILVLLVYVTILTGSRKSFLSMCLIIGFWLVFVALNELKELEFLDQAKGILAIMLVVVIMYYLIYPYYSESVLTQRLTTLFETGSDTREGMYDVAFALFKENPLIGIGFNNYRVVSVYKTYSHSTYAEALACTGLIGSLIYFLPFLSLLINNVRMAFNIQHPLNKQSRVMLGLLGVLLFLGIGVIHFYSLTSSIAFGMLIAFRNIYKQQFFTD